MKRYHSEQHIIDNQIKQYRRLNASWLEFGGWVTSNSSNTKDAGRYRKSLRCGGCTRARCQVCHPEKYPKRIPTRQEKQNWRDDE